MHLLPQRFITLWIFGLLLACISGGLVCAADFLPGDLVVYRVGTGSAALSSSGTAVFVDEYTPAGVLVQSIALPTTASGSNHQLVSSGTAASEGQLTRSSDGSLVVVTGYQAALGTASLSSSLSTSVPRVIGLVNLHGAIDTTTALTDAASGNNPRSATSDGTGNLYFAGAAGGLRYATIGATTSTELNTTNTNISVTEVLFGQLWASSAKNGFIAEVGSGLPTTSGQTFTDLGLGAITPNSFVLLQLGPGPFPDTVYEAENTATIKKFSLVAGTFVASGSYTLSGVTGLTATVSGAAVTLYATNGTGISTVTDASGYNAAPTGTLSTLVAAPTNTAFRGIAGAPASPPTITSPGAQTIAENTASAALPILVTSGEASPTLTLTASADNPTLLPASGIVLAGSGANRTVILTPTIGVIGSTTVQVTVNDAATGLAASTSFLLTVEDTPPIITTVPDQTIVHDTSTSALPVTIGDLQTPAANLVLSATSSNPVLLPATGILLGGTGANRTITLTPAAGQAGTSTITLTVNDGQGMSASSSFVLTVSNGTTNTPPTISSLADQQINQNTATAALAITVGDAQTPASALVMSAGSSNPALLPLSGISFGGTGANRTITLAPAIGQIGTSTVTVTVTDQQSLATSVSLVLTVVDTPPTIAPVASQLVLMGTSTPAIPVTVNDAETPANNLLLSASSSNTALLPTSGIVFAGSGASRTVTLTPLAGQTGTSTVTLTVDDTQGMTASTSFVLTSAADRPPVAGIHAMTAVSNRITVVPAQQFSALDSDPDGDPELITAVGGTTAAGGTVALVDGKIIYTPPSASFSGTDSFTYTLRDGVQVSQPIPSLGSLGWDDIAHTVPVDHSGWGLAAAPVPGTTDEYYLLADRGPNGDTSVLPVGSPAASDPNAVVFPIPDYDPEIAHVRWNADGSMTLLSTLPIHDATAAPLSGRPPQSSAANGFQLLDVPYDIYGNPEPFDANGLDSEGMVALPDGTFWVSDEYGPWMLHLDAAGTTLERMGPFAPDTLGNKLPLVLAKRLQNKGMEGLTITPDGTLLVGMMQAALQNDPVNDADGSKNKKNLMTRLITFRLVASASEPAGTVHQYAYVLDDPATGAASSNKMSISECTALSNTEILVDERDGNFPSAPGGAVKLSWVCHLPSGLPGDATPIDDPSDSASGLSFAGETLETLTYDLNPPALRAALASHGIVVLPKDPQALVDLSLVGLDYDHDKVEGMVYANGKVLYSNDDDFGINGSAAKILPGSYPVGSYALSNPGGLVTDYEQMLSIDPTKLLSATGTITVQVQQDTPPTIAAVGNVSIPENTATQPITVTIGDAETPAANLLLSAASSNPALVPSSGLILGGTGTSRTLILTPAMGQIGTATITLTVDDTTGMVATTTFTLTVVDTPPVISPVANQTVALNTSTAALPVTIGDAETPAANLILSGTSSNQTVLPNSGIVLGGSGSSRTVSLVPANGHAGTSTVTLTVADGQGMYASTTIVLTVNRGATAVTWQAPAAITYGTALGAAQLDATASVPGTFTYLPAAGTIPQAVGAQTLSVTFIPTDAVDYSPSTGTTSVMVNPAALTITANSFTIPVGAPLPTYTASYSGFVNGDTSAALSTLPTFTSKAKNSTTVASYPITVSGAVDANYSISYVPGTLSVIIPTNDMFAAASLLSGLTASVTTYNRAATLEAGEPAILGQTGGTSLWWTWTAPATGMVTIDTLKSSFDTLLAVYVAAPGTPSVSTLTVVAANDDYNSGTTSEVTFQGVAGTKYWIAVDGKNAASGTLDLNLVQLPYPANDTFANAQLVTGANGSISGSNVGATTEPGEPSFGSTPAAASIWYEFVAPAGGGLLEIDTFGSSFNTLLGLYTGSSVSALQTIASDNNASGTQQSQISLWIPGGTYFIAVDGINGKTGSVNLDWSFTPAPANDDIVKATTLGSSPTGSLLASNAGASKEAGEPNHAGNAGGASIWYSFTPATNGSMTLSATGAAINTLVEVYTCSSTPASVTALTAVKSGSDNGGLVSQVDVLVSAGTTYYLAVDGKGGAEGAITVAWNFLPNDAFADAISLNGLTAPITASNIDGTKESGEPEHADNAGGASVWWTFTVPAGGSGYLEIDTMGSDFDTLLAVYTQKAGKTTVSTLTAVAADDISATDTQSEVIFKVTAGTTYYIAVDGYDDAQGQIILSWELMPSGGG